MQRRHVLAIALTASVVALPASSQQGKTPPTNLYIDVLTHNMAGMPDMGGMMGGLGGFMARRMGGDAGKPTYPTTRTGGMTGQYLDIALHNSLKPGVEAQDVVPAGLKLGKSLTLTPIGPREDGKGTMAPGKVPDIQVKITEYWGCGASVRPGQPKVATFKLKGNGKTVDPDNPMGAMQGIDFQATGSISNEIRAVDRDIDLKPGWVYWPNPKHGKQVPGGARLAGEHRITGDGIPASMQFQVAQAADFMPKLALRTQGEMTDAIGLSWPAVERARGYHITGMHMQVLGENSYAITMWSSAELPGAREDLHANLTGGQLEKWLKQKVLLPATATSCTIPKGIFAGTSKVDGRQATMPGMLNMTAYGPESWITYPPKPADPKQPWNPEWSVRLRARSSASAILGLDFGGMQQMEEDGEDGQPQQKKPGMKGLLKGILGG